MTYQSGLEVLRKYNGQVPRYTSYPPSPYFAQDPEDAHCLEMIRDSNRIGARNVSFYFHVPFCPNRCLFCGCQTEIGKPGSFISRYMNAMGRELDLLLPMLDASRPVTQIHFGGGTPNSVPFTYLGRLLAKLAAVMQVDAGAEVAIECDPNLLTLAKLGDLAALGFNRLSIGIQDFDVKVLDAVNRRFPKLAPKELFREARALGFSGNNLDLIYGLPHQTTAGFRATIAKAIEADPDRISLFPYAHVPWIKGHQSRLQDLPMPDAETRLDLAWESRETLLEAGYVAIGMDHFAKPGDELAQASLSHGLHRNFQGYCVAARAGQVYGLGASSISQLQAGYYQNAKQAEKYLSIIDAGRLPFEAAYRMHSQDLAVRGIINALLCEGEADIGGILDKADVDREWKAGYLAASMSHLSPLIEDGLATLAGHRVLLTEFGWYASRTVAAAFDPLQHHASHAGQPRFSRAI